MITSTWHVLALVLSVGSAFLFYYLIKLLIQVKHTLKTLESTLTQLQNEVSPVINNVEGITDNFEQITGRADEIIESVQNKTIDTMGIIDSLKNNIDILKHTLFLLLNHLSKYMYALGIGFKAGIEHFKEPTVKSMISMEVINKKPILAAPANMEIIDHLEHLGAIPK